VNLRIWPKHLQVCLASTEPLIATFVNLFAAMYRRSGGGSSISLAWDEPAPAQRPKTRARTPPGGRSSISLGWGNDTGYNPRAKTPPRHQDKENDAAARSEFPRRQQESSNNYACGRQQNIGNYITDKPTTRVTENPGGASHFSLGWDEAKVAPPRPASGTPWQQEIYSNANGDSDAGFLQATIDSRQNQQNSANFATGRPTTRVCATPGGASSLNLGWDDDSSTLPRGKATLGRDRGTPPPAAMDFHAGGRNFEARFPADDRVPFQGRADAEVNPLEDSPRDRRGRSLHHLSKEEPRGVSLPDSDSEAEQVHAEGGAGYYDRWGGAQHAAVTPGAGSNAASTAGGHGRGDLAFGQRPRESANSFASGRQQNVGNYITERPTTRVAANPGGASSLRLGWDDEGSSTPKQTNRTPRQAALGGQSRADYCNGLDAIGIHPSQDADHQLRSLKARTAKNQQSTTPRGSVVSSCGDSSQGREKPEVAGSKPRVWRPSLAPRAPPGGAESHGCCYDARFDGRGRVDGAGGAGLNRDNNAIHALRYYQDNFRVGKHQASQASHQPEKQHVDSHRYFLHDQGQSELKPGKARLSHGGGDAPKQSLLAWPAEAPLPGRSNAARRQRTPPPEAPFEEPSMHHRGWRNHQNARYDDVEADIYSEDMGPDTHSMR